MVLQTSLFGREGLEMGGCYPWLESERSDVVSCLLDEILGAHCVGREMAGGLYFLSRRWRDSGSGDSRCGRGSWRVFNGVMGW